MSILEKLYNLGETLPPAPPPGGRNYLPFRKVGSLVFLAGAISMRAGVVTTGKVGIDRSVEEGYEAAKLCVLNHMAVLNAAFGSLEVVRQVVTVNGYVNAAPDFPDPPLVINGRRTCWWRFLARQEGMRGRRWALQPCRARPWWRFK